jgi:hypothetical protein
MLSDMAQWFAHVWETINTPDEDDWAWLLVMALVLFYLVAGPKKRKR